LKSYNCNNSIRKSQY